MTESAALTWRPQLQQQQQEGAAAPPAAPVATPAPPAATEAPTAPAAAPVVHETLSEDEQIIYDLRREHDAKVLEATPTEPLPAKKKAKGEKQEPEPAAPPVEIVPTTAGPVKYKSPEEAVSSIVAAIESGDAKRIAKALGKPEAFLDTSNAKWVAFREQQNAVRERDKQVTQREHEFNTKIAEARAEFGPAIKAAKAYRDGDLTAFVTLVQELTGDRYDDAQRKVIRGEIAIDPATRALREEIAALKRERQAEKEAAEAARRTDEQKAQYERAIEAVSNELAGHRVSKVKGYQREILNRVRDSWDPADNAYTLSFEEAADAIMAERDAEAEALGYQRPAPAPPPAPPAPPPGMPPRARAADARKPDVEPWADPDAEDMDDDAIIESIKRDVKAGRLKA